MQVLLLDLSDEEQQRAGAALDSCPTVELPAGASRTPQELPPAVLFLVDSGVVVVGRDVGRRIVVALAERGDAIVPPAPGERVTALEDARLTAITENGLNALIGEREAARALIRSLVEAVCERQRSLANLGRFPHVERVRAKLLQLAQSHGRVSDRGVVIALPLTHDLLAEMIGSARETVTWAMRELMASGFLDREGRLYRLDVNQGDLDSSVTATSS